MADLTIIAPSKDVSIENVLKDIRERFSAKNRGELDNVIVDSLQEWSNSTFSE